MLSIAICDDDRADLRWEQAYLEEYLQARPDLGGQVFPFLSGQSLLNAAETRGGFDLYILDVVMPEMDGIRTGLALRAQGDGGEILYLTSSNGYAAESYDAAAFSYLLKPVERVKLFTVLDRAVQAQERRETAGIVVRTPRGLQHLLLERILYAERVKNTMRYCCTDGTVDSSTLRCSFQEAAAPLLADRRFTLCGASFVLNLQHIRGVEPQAVLLDTGVRLPIPRRAAPALKGAWGAYWLEDMRL